MAQVYKCLLHRFLYWSSRHLPGHIPEVLKTSPLWGAPDTFKLCHQSTSSRWLLWVPYEIWSTGQNSLKWAEFPPKGQSVPPSCTRKWPISSSFLQSCLVRHANIMIYGSLGIDFIWYKILIVQPLHLALNIFSQAILPHLSASSTVIKLLLQ